MKLSKKGRDRLYGSHNVFYDDDIEGDVVALYELSEVWEFEPDDFEGCVVLTVEEAKNIYHDFASMYVIAKGTYPKDGMRKPYTLDILKMQIEQVEGK